MLPARPVWLGGASARGPKAFGLDSRSRARTSLGCRFDPCPGRACAGGSLSPEKSGTCRERSPSGRGRPREEAHGVSESLMFLVDKTVYFRFKHPLLCREPTMCVRFNQKETLTRDRDNKHADWTGAPPSKATAGGERRKDGGLEPGPQPPRPVSPGRSPGRGPTASADCRWDPGHSLTEGSPPRPEAGPRSRPSRDR